MPQLKKIKKIKNYRNFVNFESDQDIYKHEIIYAPNGSGKTHLSRLFMALQNPDVDLNNFKSKEANENDEIKVDLCFDKGDDITDTTRDSENVREILAKILVFNNDYVNKNISCPDFKEKDLSGEVILELGKEDVAVSKARKEVSDYTKAVCAAIDGFSEDFANHVNDLKSSKYSSGEKNIWKVLDITKIITINQQEKAKSIFNSECIEKILSADYADAEQRRKDLLSLESEDRIPTSILLPPIDLQDIKKELKKSTLFPTDDEKVANSVNFLTDFLKPYLSGYSSPAALLEQSFLESENREHCLLCDRALDATTKKLFSKYKAFLAGEKSKYEIKLSMWQTTIDKLVEAINELMNTQEKRVNKLCVLLRLQERWVKYVAEDILIQLNKLQSMLEAKKGNPAEIIKIDFSIEEALNNLKNQISANNKLVSKINKKMDDASAALAAARSAVGEKELQSFISNHKNQIDNIEAIQQEMAKSEQKLREAEEKAPRGDIRQQICKLFNYFMKKRLGVEKYNAEIVNKQIIIKLNDIDISESMGLISEGEKNMMGLAYYMASSIQTLNSKDKFGEAIFVIDDPVSSVSYSNIFGICTLLFSFQNDIIETVWKKKSIRNGQIIVLTHNIQFFNIMRNQIWSKEKGAKEGQEPRDGYSILNSNTMNRIKMGHLLSDFESSLLTIYQADKNKTYFNVCNSIRRVCEILKHFYGIREDFTAETIKKIFPYATEQKYDALYKTINFFSHGSANGTDILPPEIVKKATEEFIEIFSHNKSPFVGVWTAVQELSPQ